MKNKILRLSTALALLVTGCQAHAFPPVLFNSTNGNVVLPTNFWAANSNALNQVISQLASNNATAIQGSNIVAGTINSNKLDAATRAMLGGGTSGGTSDYNALINKPVLGSIASASASSYVNTNAWVPFTNAWVAFTNFCATNTLTQAQALSGAFPFHLQSATGYAWSNLVGMPLVVTNGDVRALSFLNPSNQFDGTLRGEISDDNFWLNNYSFTVYDSGAAGNIISWLRDDHFMIGLPRGSSPYLSFWGNNPVPEATIFGFNLTNCTADFASFRITAVLSDYLIISNSVESGSFVFSSTGQLQAGGFAGDGGLLTGLSASQLNSGTVSVARLPGISTNLQFTFGTTRTNTLYFTNGILMRVSQP